MMLGGEYFACVSGCYYVSPCLALSRLALPQPFDLPGVSGYPRQQTCMSPHRVDTKTLKNFCLLATFCTIHLCLAFATTSCFSIFFSTASSARLCCSGTPIMPISPRTATLWSRERGCCRSFCSLASGSPSPSPIAFILDLLAAGRRCKCLAGYRFSDRDTATAPDGNNISLSEILWLATSGEARA